jgi:hypothetical protein
MQRTIVITLVFILFASLAAAQPQNGDLVLTVGLTQGTNGFTGFMNPRTASSLTTLIPSPKGKLDNFVRMAPDNRDLVIGRYVWSTPVASGELVQVRPSGTQSTVLATSWTQAIDSFELDHDDQWIVTTRSNPQSPPVNNSLLGVQHTSHAVTKFTSLVTVTSFNELVIDRDPGVNLPYTIVTAYHKGTPGPQILRADRQGTIVTMASGPTSPWYLSIELHPRSGHYIACYGGNVIRMNKAFGTLPTLTSGFGGNALKVTQDDFLWIANGTPVSSVQHGWVLEYDLTGNAVVTMMPTHIPQYHFLTGIEVYGSRTLVCNQQSPSRVTVQVQSRHPSAGPGAQYALAASLARRPGLRFPHGEWLDLNTASCPLFFATALNLLPNLFQHFRGTLNEQGNNAQTIQVSIPAKLQGTGIPVFVAGVLFNGAGVFQVTNTHWFVL